MTCAVGFSLHSGWAIAVALGGTPREPEVLLRRRVELVAGGLPRQVFHAAAELPHAPAEQLVHRVERSAAECAGRELKRLCDDVAALGHTVGPVALCAEPREVPADVAKIIANHTLIHSAEGELYREALEWAADDLGLPVLQVDAKRVAAGVTARLGLAPARQKELLAELGRALGPPWQADHKRATLLAMVALAELRVSGGS